MTKSFSFIFLEPGDKVMVVHRRLFENDRSRYFIGTVDGFNEENGLLKVTGHTFCETRRGQFAKKAGARTKILSLTSGTLIVYQLPLATSLDTLTLAYDTVGGLWLKDGAHLALDLSESVSE